MRIFRCPELKRLPKSSRYTSVHWKNQTPGSLEPFYSGAGSATEVLDRSHPLAGIKKPKFPYIRHDDLGIKLMPMGLLLKEPRLFAPIPPLTWDERVQKAVEAGIKGVPNARSPSYLTAGFKAGEQLYPHEDYNTLIIPERRIPPRDGLLQLALQKVARRVPMSCHISTSKKRMGSDRYMRRETEKRLRASLNYIVARGAYYDAVAKRIKFNPEDAGRQWVMQGWAYLFFPSIELYRKPYGEFITFLRFQLQNVNKQAIALENEWLNRSLLNLKPAPQRMSAPSEVKPEVIVSRSKSRKTSSKAKTMRASPTTPSKTLSGKTPDVWESELLTGMKLISKRLASNQYTAAEPSNIEVSHPREPQKESNAQYSDTPSL